MILIMEILILLCLLDLFFVPRDARMLFHAAARGASRIESYEEVLSASTTAVLDDSLVPSLKTTGDETLRVPVTIAVTVGRGANFGKVVKSISYKIDERDYEQQETSYYDAGERILYSEDGTWFTGSEGPEWLPSLPEVFDVPDAVLAEATFRRTMNEYRISFPAADSVTALLEPILRNEGADQIEAGTVTYVFGKFSRRLKSIRYRDLVLSGEKKAPGNDGFAVRITFRKYDEMEEGALRPDEELRSKAKAKKPSLKQKAVTLSMSMLTERGLDCYTVGTDIAKGTYSVRCTEGSGIITGIRGRTAKEFFSYPLGYDYYKIDGETDGEEVTLKDGDRILLAGDHFSCEFVPSEAEEHES